MATSASAPLQSRPYRSHRVPACIRCRSRKIRCHIDIPGEPCLSCRERRLKCQYAEHTGNTSPIDATSLKRRRLSSDATADDDTPSRPRSAPVLHKPSTHPSARIILAPHVAEDVAILERHISKLQNSAPQDQETYQSLLDDKRNPIVYLNVPRFRTGVAPREGAGTEQLEIVTQLMGVFHREVVELYFTHVHPSFPILDEETCSLLRKGTYEKLSKPLLCVLFAIGTPHWHRSEVLKMHPRPDTYYVWNKAISATLDDFLSPSLSTVAAATIDQIGRPSISMVGNANLCGRTVTLAQMFGLHRDPSKWNITSYEKTIRIRIWWGVLITDHWTSVAYGTLPAISKRFYDVPMPTLEGLAPSRAPASQKYASTCFIHLCHLTEFLGDVLPFVYDINPDRVALVEFLARAKQHLNELERELPEWLPLPKIPGTSNLWFCFLSMRLLLSRVAIRSAALEINPLDKQARLDDLLTTSSAVLDFVLSLEEYNFLDFWLPYVSHLLVHAITVSLRCTVETQDISIRNASISRLQRVMTHIQNARENYDWDIAAYCLERCSRPVAQIASLAAQSTTTSTNPNPQPSDTSALPPAMPDGGETLNGDDITLLLSDLLDPNAIDFSWEALWDAPNAMLDLSI